MPKKLEKPRLHSKKNKPEYKQEPTKTKSNLLPNLQSFTQKLVSGNGFLVYKWA